MTQLFPRPPFYRQNAGASGLWLETEGDETKALIRVKASQPIEPGDVLHFSIGVYVLNAPLEIYHGDRLIHAHTSFGPIELDYTATSSANYFEFRSEGQGSLVETAWPSIKSS